MKKLLLLILPIVMVIWLVSCGDVITIENKTTNDITTIQTTEFTTNQNLTTDVLQVTTDIVLTTEDLLTTEDVSTTEDVTLTEEVTTQAQVTTENIITTELVTTTEEPTIEIEDLDDSLYQYSSYSTQNIKILHLDITDDVIVYSTAGVMITLEDVLVKNDVYEIKSSYVLSHEGYEYVAFYLQFDNQRTLVQISLNDKEVPYIISSTVVTRNTEDDLLFQFELFNGNVRQISANEMDESDYLINGNIVTIFADYIDERLLENDSLMINYVLEDNQLVIGFISIDK